MIRTSRVLRLTSASVALVALAASSCSTPTDVSGPGAAQHPRTASAEPPDTDRRATPTPRTRGNARLHPAASPGASDPRRRRRSGTSDPRVEPRAHRSVVVDYKRDTDSSGDEVAFGDIVRAVLIDRGRSADMRLTVRAPLPRRLGDETYMTVGFRFEMRDGDEAYVYLNGDSGGWQPDMRSVEGERFRGAFTIDGATVRIVVPWAKLGDPASLRWRATTSWVRSDQGDTHYQFDSAPDHTGQRFRRRSARRS